MKKIIDNFSIQSNDYKKYRPEYPEALINEILKYVPTKNNCLDCGTGNGQLASKLSNHFKNTLAVDISINQLKVAGNSKNLCYIVARSEQTPFRYGLFDLITIAQAIHWFDLQKFREEIIRLSVDNGVLALIGYGLVKIDIEIDKVINDFYINTMGKYWDSERRLVENEYDEIDLNLEYIIPKKYFFLRTKWSVQELFGYLNSWSSVQKYINQNGDNPVSLLENKISHAWSRNQIKIVKFPLFLKLYSIKK